VEQIPVLASSFVCDFCGADAQRVRRVALDRGYDRLGVRHAVRYACETCSRDKDRERVRKRAVDASGHSL
jgi:hypothetical protein